MIDQLEIFGFKRFKETLFNLKPLTVLTGLNGSGKTSVIHSLLVMHEATLGIAQSIVRLNGPFELQLGTAGDVVNWDSSEELVFKVRENCATSTWRLGRVSDDDMHLVVEELPGVPPLPFRGTQGSFEYLAAERLGPRASLEASPLPVESLGIGVRGEYCAQILEKSGSKPCDPDRLHPDFNLHSLLKYEVERWLSEIARPIEIDAIRYQGSTIYALNFRSPDGTWVRATNMGFGVSYALPIILAGLTAVTGGMLIIENPEAHLHPAGQSRMGVFLAWVASKGVQVIVETHSDHVLNGIRRAIGEHKFLNASDAIVHYFGSEDETHIDELYITPVGGISDWPKGFFDQYQIDTAALGRIRRRGA